MKKQMLDTITRRDFLKLAAMTGTTLGLESVLGCATTQVPMQDIAASLAAIKPEQVVYPKLPGNKVQAPENGCLVGFRKVYVPENDPVFIGKQKDMAGRAKNIDDYVTIANKERVMESIDIKGLITKNIQLYEQAFGAKPAIYVISDTPRLYLDFPEREAEAVASNSVIPYINAAPGSVMLAKLRFGLDDILSGKRDTHLKKFAEGAKKFGERFGGFFMTTMVESNADWNYWGQSAKFIPTWQHIWQVFEDNGANQYATWVWELYCPEGAGKRAVHPDNMYPGDKYIDWIGLSAFSRQRYHSSSTLGELAGNTSDQMHKNHRNKPIMQAEFAVTNNSSQPRWLMDAFKTIKSKPSIKAAIYWDNVTAHEQDDHTLSDRSLQALKEIFKDPYWIMAK